MLNKCLISGFADEIDTKLETQIEVLHGLKQEYIELRAADGVGVSSYTLEQAKSIKKRLDKADIKVSSIGSPIGKILITDDFEPHFEVYKHVVDIAKIMETKNIRMFSFYIPEGENPWKYEEEVYFRIEKMIDYAKEHDVILLHENEKEIFGDNAERCLQLMERYFCNHFQCVFDFANFVQCQQNTWEAYEMLKPYIVYLHIKDALQESGEVVVPGTGDGKLAEILYDLDKAGYEGFLSLEPHLVDFAGFASLEKKVETRKLSDSAAAYTLAHDALIKILEGNSTSDFFRK